MSDNAVIMLVDDDDNDRVLIRRVFQHAKILNCLVTVRSGEEAIDYLSGLGQFSNRAEHPLPSLILLDIKMPTMDGFEVLRWIRAQPGISAIRVVMLTSSNDVKDVDTAYKLGANSFLVKPVDFDRFLEVARALSGYWLWMDRAPTAERTAPAKKAASPPASTPPPI